MDSSLPEAPFATLGPTTGSLGPSLSHMHVISLVFPSLLWGIGHASCPVRRPALKVAAHNDGGSRHALFQVTPYTYSLA